MGYNSGMRKWLLLALLLCLGCGSGEPPADQFTGVWSDGETNTVEFVAPNTVLWVRTRKGNRSYLRNSRRVKEKDVALRTVRVGFYSAKDGELEFRWVDAARSRMSEVSQFKVEVQESSLQLSGEDPWSGKSFESSLAKRQGEPLKCVGLWQSEKKSDREGRLLSQTGLCIDFGKLSHLSVMERREGRVHSIKEYQAEKEVLKVRELNWVERDGLRTQKLFWQRNGARITFLKARERERGIAVEDGYPMQRVKEPLSVEKGRIEWIWPE